MRGILAAAIILTLGLVAAASLRALAGDSNNSIDTRPIVRNVVPR